MSNERIKIDKSSTPQEVVVDPSRSATPQQVNPPSGDSGASSTPQNVGGQSGGTLPPADDD